MSEYTPLELLQHNPHDLWWDDEVICPDGSIGILHHVGWTRGKVGSKSYKLKDLRPSHLPPPIEQLSLIYSEDEPRLLD